MNLLRAGREVRLTLEYLNVVFLSEDLPWLLPFAEVKVFGMSFVHETIVILYTYVCLWIRISLETSSWKKEGDFKGVQFESDLDWFLSGYNQFHLGQKTWLKTQAKELTMWAKKNEILDQKYSF